MGWSRAQGSGGQSDGVLSQVRIWVEVVLKPTTMRLATGPLRNHATKHQRYQAAHAFSKRLVGQTSGFQDGWLETGWKLAKVGGRSRESALDPDVMVQQRDICGKGDS